MIYAKELPQWRATSFLLWSCSLYHLRYQKPIYIMISVSNALEKTPYFSIVFYPLHFNWWSLHFHVTVPEKNSFLADHWFVIGKGLWKFMLHVHAKSINWTYIWLLFILSSWKVISVFNFIIIVWIDPQTEIGWRLLLSSSRSRNSISALLLML